MNTPLTPITPDTATALIIQGLPLQNVHVTDTLDLSRLEGKINSELIIENCLIEDLVSPFVAFNYPVRILGPVFNKCSFYSAYFNAGLLIDHSTFKSYLDFQMGGHNQYDTVFCIQNSTFEEFVNFFDCWFQSRVIISQNDFRRGSNLMGNKNVPYSVHFDMEPVIENNSGQIDLDGEGSKQVNTIWHNGLE